mmetsp:Transcript_13421/g.32620  ORF Transcript_13421/g.32620 Transcript_13421/m.32620 type:complete len:205 (-) Transcript_13421:442-1056(-)
MKLFRNSRVWRLVQLQMLSGSTSSSLSWQWSSSSDRMLPSLAGRECSMLLLASMSVSDVRFTNPGGSVTRLLESKTSRSSCGRSPIELGSFASPFLSSSSPCSCDSVPTTPGSSTILFWPRSSHVSRCNPPSSHGRVVRRFSRRYSSSRIWRAEMSLGSWSIKFRLRSRTRRFSAKVMSGVTACILLLFSFSTPDACAACTSFI